MENVVNDSKYITHPTWRKHTVLAQSIDSVQIKQKRVIFHLLRSSNDPDAFLPEYGFTAGAFCIWQILSDSKRARRSK